MTRLRATAAHTIPQRPPIRVTPGQQVQAGQRDTDWPAFVFITTDDGAGWVPERHLDTSSDPAVVITAYDTTELATTGGEELTLIEQTTRAAGHGSATPPAGRDGCHCAPSSRCPDSNRRLTPPGPRQSNGPATLYRRSPPEWPLPCQAADPPEPNRARSFLPPIPDATP